jgi:hypothetical protein
MLKGLLKRSVLRAARLVERDLRAPLRHDVLSQQNQLLLRLRYREMYQTGRLLPSFRDVGFKCFSEFEEDGIILFLFSIIGEQSRRVVEMCSGHARTCMSTNVIINHGWEGFLFDGNERLVSSGKRFFAEHPATRGMPPALLQVWVTAENVNDLLRSAGVEGEIDLLSLDMDGNDYWIWRAIEVIRPRLVVAETHDIIPTELALTIPYSPEFNAWENPKPDFRGASLRAMTKLAGEKGYRLIGAHQRGFNVFYLRNDVAPDVFAEVDTSVVHDNPRLRQQRAERWRAVKDMPWVVV